MTKISKFYKLKKIKDNVYAIFNSLMMDVLFVDKSFIKKIEKVDVTNEEKSILIKSGIYIDNENSEYKQLNYLKNRISNITGKINTVYIIVSNNCNLKCKYCFIENNIKNNNEIKNMNYNVIDNFLEKYSLYLKSQKIVSANIIFYGGEPLINWDIVKYCVEKGRNLFPFNFSIITNGTLLNDEKLDLIKKYNVGIGISIDGPKIINDTNRIFKNKTLSVYDTIINQIEQLKNHNINFSLSVTISDIFIKNQEKILNWIEKLDVRNVNYNLMHFNKPNTYLEEYYKNATHFLIKSYEKLKPLDISDDRINRKIDSFVKHQFNFADCAAITGNQITIKPNGEVTVCQGNLRTNENTLGNILYDDFNKIVDNEQRKIWFKEQTLLKDECLNCEALFICGRGCCLQSEQAFGNKSKIDKGFCAHTKISFDWLLKNLYTASL